MVPHRMLGHLDKTKASLSDWRSVLSIQQRRGGNANQGLGHEQCHGFPKSSGVASVGEL